MTQRTVRRKLVIVGDVSCGKTSFCSAYAHGRSTLGDGYMPTVYGGLVGDFTVDETHVELGFWDNDTSERFSHLRPLAYPSTHVVLILFAIDSPTSLQNAATKWHDEVRERCGPNVPILLVGCKSDRRSETPYVVSREAGQEVANMIGAHGYYECSAHKFEGFTRVLEDAARASLDVETKQAGRCCIVC